MLKIRRFGCWLQVVCGLFMFAGRVALAQPAQDDFSRLIDQATNATKQGHIPEAIDAWKQAYALHPKWWIACSIGRASLRLERLTDAAKWLNVCTRSAPPPNSEEWIAERGKEVLELATIKMHLVTVDVDAEDGALIIANGEMAGTAPLKSPLYFPPGKIKLEARKDGASTTREFTAERGETRALTLRRDETPAPSPPLPSIENPAPPALAPAPNVVPVELLQPEIKPTAWSKWTSVVRSDPWVFGMIGALVSGFYVSRVESAQQDLYSMQLGLAVKQERVGLHVEAASSLDSAKSANFWRAVCAGLYPALYGIGGAMFVAWVGTSVTSKVSIGRDSASIQGGLQW